MIPIPINLLDDLASVLIENIESGNLDVGSLRRQKEMLKKLNELKQLEDVF